MTYEEAIEYITERYVTMSMCLSLDECRKHNKAISMAIDALEKQRPKKPKNTKCQSCNHYIPMVVRDRKMRFCPFCGQKIDWSGDE